VLTPTSMKRFYLAVPVENEDDTIRKLGELGAVQLTREIPVERGEKTETVEAFRKFMRLYERMNTVLAKAAAEKIKATIMEATAEPSFDQIKSFVDEIESKLDESIRAVEKTEAEIKNSKIVEENLGLLETYGLKVDEIGNFRHIFVKAGFLNNALIPKLSAYTGGTSIVYTSKPGRPRESFVLITGLNEDRGLIEDTLKLLNFEEFTLPQGVNPQPKVAMEEVNNQIALKEKETTRLKEDLWKIKEQFDFFAPHVSNGLVVEETKGSIARTKKKSLIHGWVPREKTELLKAVVEEAVPQKESIYLRFENPHSEDIVPVQHKPRSIFGAYSIFTYLQGVPNYFEINPTPIYTILYIIMFGMMFGDMGLGAVFIVIGVLLARSKKGFLVFSTWATRKLGQIVVSCGISAVVFGALYGELFLLEIIRPILLSPLHEITQIIIIALVFGVIQMTLALSLNVVNRVRRKERLKAIFSGKGLVGLIYYVAGVFLGVAFITELGFGAFLQARVLPFTIIALVSLALIFLSPLIESKLEGKKAKVSEKVIEGFGEGLETLIAYISNSVSYIRLAAFAIAHGALGLAAVIFASVVGDVPSYIIMNVIVFLVEGFAAFIQSLRLMYYEFSTKFYVGDGSAYKPFKVTASKTKT